MTRKEKQIVYKAAEMIATNKELFSCNALAKADLGLPGGVSIEREAFSFGDSKMRDRYSSFYKKNPNDLWIDGDPFGRISYGGLRILMLALFAEAEGDV